MRLPLRQLGWTLRAMAARRRTWLGFAAFLFLDLVVLGMMQSESLREAARHFYLKDRRFATPENFSGLTVAHFILTQSLGWLAPLFLALVAGDAVAREIEDGTMRMALARPVSRVRVLLLRWIACGVQTFALAFFLCAVALGCGLIDQGFGNLLVTLPEQRTPVAYAFSEGMARYALGMPLLGLSLLTITSLAFLFSCAPMRPLSAAIATVSFVFSDRFLWETPFFKVFRPWLLSTCVDRWLNVYAPEIPWRVMVENSARLLAIDFVLVAAACLLFARRDLKP